jgi:hypothetical protein
MGDDLVPAGPAREQLEERLRDARRREFEALVRANQVYETASQAESEAAFAQHQAVVDEIARLEKELAELDQPRESILDELDAESERAAMLAGMGETGEGQTLDGAQAEANQRNRRTLAALALSGSILALGILAWLAWQQGSPTSSPTTSPSTPSSAAPTGALATASPAPPTPTPAAPTITPVPLAERPVTGSAFGVASFVRTSGSCPIANEFTAEFTLEAVDGDAVLTQLPIDHVTNGSLTRTGASSGRLLATAEGQRYEAAIAGSLVLGTYLHTQGGCRDEYAFQMYLDRPLLAPSPLGDAPAALWFVDQDNERVLDITDPGPEAPGLLLTSRTAFDFGSQLPIQVSVLLGEDTVSSFRIESNPPTPAPMPPEMLAAMLSGPRPVLVATGNSGDVLGVYAPRDIDWELAWLAELLSGR